MRTSDRCHWCGNPPDIPGAFVSRMSLRGGQRPTWQSVFPLAPLRGLAAKPTERVKNALSAPLGHLSHRERQDPHPSWLRRATFPQGKAGVTDCHVGRWPPRNDIHDTIVLGISGGLPHQRAPHYGMTATGSHGDFDSLRGAPLVRNDMCFTIE